MPSEIIEIWNIAKEIIKDIRIVQMWSKNWTIQI